MQIFLFLGFFLLGVLSLSGRRWAYVTFVVLGLLYFPASVGFRCTPQPCELSLDLPLAIHSLTNYKHIVLLALFFLMTSAQFRQFNGLTFAWAALATVVMGALVELAEGVTGNGHCRLRDLIPDTAGALLGGVIAVLWRRTPPADSPGTADAG